MPPHTIQEQSAKRKVALRQRFAGQRRDLATKPMVRPGINAVSATRDTHSPMRADIPAPKISAPGRAPGIGYSHQILPGRQIDASTCTGTKAMSKRIWANEETARRLNRRRHGATNRCRLPCCVQTISQEPSWNNHAKSLRPTWRTHSCVPCRDSSRHLLGAKPCVGTSADAARTSACRHLGMAQLSSDRP